MKNASENPPPFAQFVFFPTCFLRFLALAVAMLLFVFFPQWRAGEARAQTAETVSLCDRTPQVRDALLELNVGPDCANVRAEVLGRVSVLDLTNKGIESLKTGDFDGLSSLTFLDLDENRISDLPEGIFRGLSSLQRLDLDQNEIRRLPEGIFRGLGLLNNLNLWDNQITILPEGIFRGLVSLRRLDLRLNQLGSLPEGIFRGLSLSELILHTNPWIDLSADAVKVSESGGTADVTVRVVNPPRYGLNFRVTTADVTATAGEDYTAVDTTLTIRAGRSSGAVSVPIAADGRFEGDETFSLNFAAVGIQIYSAAADSLTAVSAKTFVTIVGPLVSVCDRTPQVRDALIRETGVADCMSISEDDLESITSLNLRFEGIESLRAGDFNGLSSLKWLFLNDNDITSLPETVFGGLSSLQFLQLDNNGITGLPEGIFSGLSSLRNLCLNNNRLAGLPEGIFSGLDSLRFLDLGDNSIAGLPEGVFSGLGSLENLNLQSNRLAGLPEGIFGGLSSLDVLNLRNNGLVSLPEGIFRGLFSLDTLDLWDNQLSSLPRRILFGLPPFAGRFSISRNPWDFALLVDDAKVAESEERLDVTVSMTEPLDYDLTLRISTGPGTATAGEDYGALASEPLTIPAGSSSGTVSITIFKDGRVEEDETFEIFVDGGPLIYPNADPTFVSARATVTISEFASVTVEPARIATSETGSAGVFTVALDARPTGDVRAEITSGDPSEGTVSSEGGSSSGGATTLTFTPQNWNTQQTVTVTGLDDDTVDGDAQYTITLATSGDDARYMKDNAAFVTVTNGDNDRAALIIDDLIVAEDAGGATVSVRLDNAVEGGFRVRASTKEGTAAADRADYENVVRTLVFSGEADETRTFTVPIVNDPVMESDETFSVSLDFLRDTALEVDTSDTATVTITESGAVLSIGNVEVNEDAAAATVTVRLNRAVPGGFTVDAFTRDGTADAGEDYTEVAGQTLTFAGNADETNSFTVRITDDRTPENDETFSVFLRNLSGSSAPVAVGGAATVTISDNDFEERGMMSVCDRTPQVRDALLRELGVTDCASVTPGLLGGMRSLNLRFEGLTSLRSGDFSGMISLLWLFLNDNELVSLPEGIFSELESLVHLQLDDNLIADLPEGVFSGLSSLRTLNLDDNRLVSLPEGVFGGLASLRYLRLDGNNLAGLPEGIFSGLGALGDLNLSKNGLTTLPAGIFNGLTVLDSLDLRDNRLTSLPKTVADAPRLSNNLLVNDNPWDFALLVGDATVAESEERLEVPVRMTSPLNYDLTLRVSTADGTAKAGEDYTAPNAALTIAAGRTTGTVSIPIIADGEVEEDETFELTVDDGPLIFSGGESTGLNPASRVATVTISEFVSVTVEPARINTSETGSTGTFTVVLDTRPTADVRAEAASGDTSEGAVSSGDGLPPGGTAALTFTPSNWNIPQTVTVTGLDDDKVDGDAEYTINLSASSGDARYMIDRAAFVSVINADNDSAALAVEDLTVSEGAGMATVSVRLGNAVAEGFRVRVATREGSAIGGRVDYEDVTRNLDFDGEAGETETFSVSIINDAIPEGQETFEILLDSLQGTTLPVGTDDSGTVTITDDDTPGVSISPEEMSLEEGGSSFYTVTLDTRPSGNVEVSVNSGSADVTAGLTSLTFTAANWNEAQTVTVMAAHDADTADETAVISHAVSGYGSVTSAPDLRIAVNDDDPDVTVEFGREFYGVTEGDAVSIRVTLSEAPGRSVTVPVVLSGGTADESDYAALGAGVTFAPDETAGTFTVSAERDYEKEPDETLLLGFGDLTAVPGVTAGGMAQTTVTIADLPPGLSPGQRSAVHRKTAGILSRSMAETVLGVIGNRLGVSPGAETEVAVAGRSALPSDLKDSDWKRFIAGKIQTAAQSGEDGLNLPEIDTLIAQTVRRSKFAVPLGNGDDGRFLTVWGAAGGLSADGDSEKGGVRTDYDADTFSALIGVDGMAIPDWRLGLAFAFGSGRLDYKAESDEVRVSGDVSKSMVSIHPYLSWHPGHDMSLWWVGGFGFGEYEISEVNENSRKTVWSDVNATDWMAAMGVERDFFSDSRRDLSLRAKGLVSHVNLNEKKSAGETLPGLTSTNWRLRFEGEAGMIFQTGYRSSFKPYVLVGMRWDGGDAVGSDSVFLDMGGGIKFQAGGALVFDVSFYSQTTGGDSNERSAHSAVGIGKVSFDPGRDGKGFYFSAQRSLTGGEGVSPSRKKYEFVDKAAPRQYGDPKVETEVGYGWEALKVYAGSRFDKGGRGSLGFDFEKKFFNLGIETGHTENTGETEALLRARMKF